MEKFAAIWEQDLLLTQIFWQLIGMISDHMDTYLPEHSTQ